MNFLDFPSDIQSSILLDLDVPTVGKFCLTNSRILSLCQNESLWKSMLTMILQSKDSIEKPEFIQISSNWKNRVRMIWNILNPRKIFTILFYTDTISATVSEQNKIELVGNFQATSIEEVEQYIKTQYLNRIEPIYSYLQQIIDHSQISFSESNDIRKVLNSTTDYKFLIRENYLFDFATLPSNKMNNLIVYDFFWVDVIFTIKGSDENPGQIYVYLATILNLLKYDHISKHLNAPSIVEIAYMLQPYTVSHPYNLDNSIKTYSLSYNYILHQLFYAITIQSGHQLDLTYDSQKIQFILENLQLINDEDIKYLGLNGKLINC